MELIVVVEKVIKETEQVVLDACDSARDGQTEIDRLCFLFVSRCFAQNSMLQLNHAIFQ
jgi:hypothetical protein